MTNEFGTNLEDGKIHRKFIFLETKASTSAQQRQRKSCHLQLDSCSCCYDPVFDVVPKNK
jgi:hypothetical protein